MTKDAARSGARRRRRRLGSTAAGEVSRDARVFGRRRPRRPTKGSRRCGNSGSSAAVVDLRLRRGSGRDVVAAAPADIPVIIFSGVPSESAELERLRPRTRLIEKPYSLVLLVETLEEMLAEAGSQNLHS